MRIETSDGVGLAVEVAGSGPALVLAHGHGGAKEDFSDHIDALARDYTVVVFDQRGHGASDKPDDPAAYSLERLAVDLGDIADHLGFATFRALGHSMGGMGLRRFVIGSPERVSALVFMDTAPGPVRGWDPEILELAAQIALEEGKVVLREALDAYSPLNNPAHYRLVAEREGYQEFMDRKWDDVSAIAWGSLMQAMARQVDDRDALTRLSCPTLVIVGALDKGLIGASKELAALVPGAQLMVVPDAGHSPQSENPQVWFDAVSGFLAGIVEPTVAAGD
jgi:pimeloyl-ACP methyl ester carboxylesterase